MTTSLRMLTTEKRRQSRAQGFSLVELLVAMSVLLTITGSALALLGTAEERLAVEPEAADMQQRLRAGVAMLHHDLALAGAGPAAGLRPGPLPLHMAAILPYRHDPLDGDPPGTFRDDALTVFYMPRTVAQSTLAAPLPARAGAARVHNGPGCGRGNPACGFAVGMAVLVFDGTGAADQFEVTDVQGDTLALAYEGASSGHVYEAGSTIAEVVARSYFLERDAAADTIRLMRGRANGGADVPVADHVVGLAFAYERAGAGGGEPVALPPSSLVDGPWLPSAMSPYRFDADLLAVTSVSVTLRVQSAIEALRGPGSLLFSQPGTSQAGRRWLPDLEVSFRVRPHNYNPGG